MQPKINTEGIISILYHLIKMKIDIMLISGTWQQCQRRTVVQLHYSKLSCGEQVNIHPVAPHAN